jgi:hypothetical protein
LQILVKIRRLELFQVLWNALNILEAEIGNLWLRIGITWHIVYNLSRDIHPSRCFFCQFMPVFVIHNLLLWQHTRTKFTRK